MRSPFSFISSNVSVVMLDMFPFQLGDFPLPEIAVGQLGMGDRQPRLPHGALAVANDVEIEGPRSPPLAAFPAPLRLDRETIRQQLGRAQRQIGRAHV